MKKLFVLLCAVTLLLCSCGAETPSEPQGSSSETTSSAEESKQEITPIVNVKDIVEKTPDEVKEILGEPSMEDGNEIYYKDNKIDVYYSDGKAATIFVDIESDLKVVSENYKTFFDLVGIDFDGQEPINTAPTCTEWQDIDGMFQVSVFTQSLDDNTVKSVYVISKKEYKK